MSRVSKHALFARPLMRTREFSLASQGDQHLRKVGRPGKQGIVRSGWAGGALPDRLAEPKPYRVTHFATSAAPLLLCWWLPSWFSPTCTVPDRGPTYPVRPVLNSSAWPWSRPAMAGRWAAVVSSFITVAGSGQRLCIRTAHLNRVFLQGALSEPSRSMRYATKRTISAFSMRSDIGSSP